MNKRQKKLIYIFIFLFAVSFILINWNDVSWLFNYRQVTGLVSDFFNPYPDTATKLIAINNRQQVIASGAGSAAPAPKVLTAMDFMYANNSLKIPSINITTPVIIGQSTDIVRLENDLDDGAVYYPGSVLPGQIGQIVILGHSAPLNWPPIKHDWIFSKVESLKPGDQIILTFNDINYTYSVIDKKIIQPGQETPSAALSATSNILTLISCWPPGKDSQRIAVTAQLVK